jgi:hypothetical protein
MSDVQLRDPVRNINQEFYHGLEMVSDRVYPLPGATFERVGTPDPRLSQLSPSTAPQNTKLTFYEHVATVRHKSTGRFFVAFRQTMDALMKEQNDAKLYPEWLIKGDLKKTELKVYIYTVKEFNGKPLLPSEMPNLSTHEDWLTHIGVPWVFDSVAYFLLSNKIISQDMYGKMK